MTHGQHPLTFAHGEGWSTIPLHIRGKHPLLKSWKEYTQRKPTAEEIATWLHRWPRCNAAVITGPISDLVVVDVDGVRGLQSIAQKTHWWQTFSVRTANGWHLYFQYPDGGEIIKSSASTLPNLPNVDIRATDGYVVGPYSSHPSGKPYTVFSNRPIAPLPPDLHDMLAALHQPRIEQKPLQYIRGISRYLQYVLWAECSNVAQTHPKSRQRNTTLNRAAFKLGQLIGGEHLPEDMAVQHLMEAARTCGLPDNEARKTIASGIRAGKAKPRQL